MTDYVANFNLTEEELNAEFQLEEEEFKAILQLDVNGSVWGNIIGDINNQTDLKNALESKASASELESIAGALNDSIVAVDNKYDSITGALDDKIDTLTGALDDKIDSVNGALSDSITALDSIVGNKADTSYVDSITGALSDSISAIDSTIGGYGDIVTYNAADFADSTQGALADTALQPNDNISELNNDVGYITSAALPTVNDGQLTIQVNGSDVATFTANQANDTIANISIPNAAEWGNITGTLSDQTDLQTALDAKVTNNATGTKALAVGDTSQSTAEGGVAVGYGARANSTYATAVGEEARANNTNTTVIGKAAKATEARAIAIGSGAEANAQDAIAIKGINNTANTFQVYTYNMLDMSTGLIPDARISANIARTVDIPTFDTTQMAAINSGANTTNIGQIATNTQDISDEITNRQNADNGLQSQIDALVVASDVFDIVGTYAELQAYDISTVPVNDIIKVLVDSTHNDAATYYRCVESGGVKSWSYIGSEGAYYTKGEADSKFALQTTTINSHALSSNITLTASDVGALPDTTVIPTVNNSSITFQKNGTDFDTITLNQSSNDTINITVPTDTNDLTNGAGYITSASLPTDYYTKSEIDAILPQPTKIPIVYYQPTDSYCYTESNNRFYGSHVFEKLYLVQPKTSGTTQVIDMSTTFSLSFTIDYQKAPSASITLAEIMTSYAAGKGVLLQLNSTGLYYRNNITGTTITGTRALTAGNSYDVKAEYDGTHMIISYKLSSDANYTQINSTTCTCDGSNYNYAAIGMNADNGNMSLSSVVLTNGADTLYSYTAGKIALDYDGSTLKLNASNQLSVDFTGYATETWVGNQGYLTSGDLTNYVTTDTAQTITAKKTFTGEKAILFQQTSNSDKLGFTLYNSSNTELGAFEYRPNTISSKALLNVNCPYTGDYVGFRYWGTAVNVIAPKPSTAGTYYIPTHITDGNTTVTAANTGTVNISSLIPTVPTNISAFTNDSGYITSSALSGYATETWVTNKGYAVASSLATVATSGDYDDLINKPTIPTALSDITVSAGSNITISGDTISATDTTYSDFTGADSVTAGTSGLVPAPSAGDEDKILTGGGAWNALKTVNSTSLLGSGDIDTSEIFVAEYDVTTYAEVLTAYNAGKTIICKTTGVYENICPLSWSSPGKFYFVSLDAFYDYKSYKFILDSSGWSVTTQNYVNKSGDTMTGSLEFDLTDNLKPIIINMDNTTGSIGENLQDIDFRLGGVRKGMIRGVHYTSGSNILQIIPYDNNANMGTSFTIGVDANSVSYCTFPDTTCVDGQWVASYQEAIGSTAQTINSGATKNIQFSNLPAKKCEVMFTISQSTNYDLTISSSLMGGSVNRALKQGCICMIMPVSSDKTIKVGNLGSGTASINFVRMCGYRVLGTNTNT